MGQITGVMCSCAQSLLRLSNAILMTSALVLLGYSSYLLHKAVAPLTVIAISVSAALFLFSSSGLILASGTRSCLLLMYINVAALLVLGEVLFSVLSLADPSALTRLEREGKNATQGSGGAAQGDIDSLEDYMEKHGRYVGYGYAALSVVTVMAFLSAFYYRGSILDQQAADEYASMNPETATTLQTQRQRNALLKNDYSKSAV